MAPDRCVFLGYGGVCGDVAVQIVVRKGAEQIRYRHGQLEEIREN
jgi:hypothetical protein